MSFKLAIFSSLIFIIVGTIMCDICYDYYKKNCSNLEECNDVNNGQISGSIFIAIGLIILIISLFLGLEGTTFTEKLQSLTRILTQE